MSTMLAAVYHNGDNMLVLENIPRPVPKANQVLLKIAAAGVCHSDTLTLDDEVDDERTYIFGHENVGYAVDIGKDVKGIEMGKLYAVYIPVPHSHDLIKGFPPFLDSIGIGKNGGYAEYLAVNATALVPVPDGLKPEVACLATDSLITAYHAIHSVAELRPGTNKRVLIYGVGGLGHQAVQIVKHYGATVYACDIKPAARELALSLGAEKAFHPSELQALFAEKEPGKRFSVDVVIDFVSVGQSFSIGQELVKGDGVSLDSPKGKVVLVGLFGDNLVFSLFELLLWRTNVYTSLYGTKEDLAASLELLATGTVKPVVATEPLENVNNILNELRAGRVTGRKVVIPGTVAESV